MFFYISVVWKYTFVFRIENRIFPIETLFSQKIVYLGRSKNEV